MNRLQWVGPFVLRDYLGGLLSMTLNVWPPARPGVYVVSSQPWTGRPVEGVVLYTGATKNLLDRMGNLIRDVLGFYGPVEDAPDEWVGKHSGAQTLWQYCRDRGEPVGDLVIGWAATASPCQWCMEKEVAGLLKPTLNKRTGIKTCCCPVAEG